MSPKQRIIKSIARVLLFVMVFEMVEPNRALALTTGPSQPEVQAFEPVGTTDMVDMFTGDFNYNIPLLDVEGYPVNISYHGGVGMEQEASWVGLGWNINPGEINRTVRGVPDDFNGNVLDKQLNIKDENVLRVGLGVGGELAGVGDPALKLSANLGANINFSNYRGISCDFDFGGGVSVFQMASAGINMGVGSQTGAQIDYNAGLNFTSSNILGSDIAGGVGVNVGSGYSSRSGLKDISLSVSTYAIQGGSSYSLGSFSATIPVGVKNYVPVITNSSTLHSFTGRIKVGLEAFWCMGYATANGMYSTLHYNNDGTRSAYGYLYAENARDSDILDFTRDKDGSFNKTMAYLPAANMTYDIYSVSGQGTGGNFRPFRNDLGSVYDPVMGSTQQAYTLGLEFGAADIFELGGDGSTSTTNITSGPWYPYKRSFTGKNTNGSIYEKTYLKAGGELTTVNADYFNSIDAWSPISGSEIQGLPFTKNNSQNARDVRSNLVYYLTGTEAASLVPGVSTSRQIISYNDTPGYYTTGVSPSTTSINRISGNPLQRQGDQISEITQLQADGRRYIYGIPAMNNIQKEATFAVQSPTNSGDLASGLVPFTPGTDDAVSNTNGIDHYFSSTTTPAYAHSYLLTSVISSDYVDITGDGITDDDLGSYTKFNYSLREPDYRWKAPFVSNKAQYNPGFWSDPNDDKGSYLIGSREQWVLHSIETKNFIAEFYCSKRNDAVGATDAIATTGRYNIAPYNSVLTAGASSYKLDSIKLYNKHDRFIDSAMAVPVKSVYFVYDSTLCPGVPNVRSGVGSAGKLTLKKIYMSYGNSQKSLISPYQFNYTANQSYSLINKDRWGNFKPNNSSFTNYEFPYVNQSDTADNTYASSWSLSSINLPSGGVIQVNYESDDYAYVQDQPATEMFMIQGIGNSTSVDSFGNALYADRNSPYLYAYFLRRQSSELSSLTFAKNYDNNLSTILFNFDVRLTNNSYEPIKGYASISDIGICPNNSAFGYIKFNPVIPTGGGATLNPVSYTAINVGRYNLPQILYPGTNGDKSDIMDVLGGLKQGFKDLLRIASNPVVNLTKDGLAKDVNLAKSYIRLSSPGMAKKGGGQRVKSLMFYDSWNALAGGNEQQATYGKQYNYTTNDDTYGTISSGVASYEPMIGGDENPLRQPVQYVAQSGSNWPPNDPVSLYQETPIGETLFPSPVVGYSKVTVTSIHGNNGRSSQGIDVYQFYTAKDFPIQVKNTSLDVVNDKYDFGIFSQENLFSARQGYELDFNDMHGKPKSVEHYVAQPTNGNNQLISYQQYFYNTANGQLNNNVPCLVYNSGTNGFIQQTQQLGVEADVTIDTRQKNEVTQNDNINVNLNTSIAFILPIPIPWVFGWGGSYQNEFQSATVTKVIQQYGILKSVKSFNQGAITTVSNELYDPNTGQVVVTSVNDEYNDKEYTVNKPAYWGHTNMGNAYTNIDYKDSVAQVPIDSKNYGLLNVGNRSSNFNVGDELLVNYRVGGVPYSAYAYVMNFKPVYTDSTYTVAPPPGTPSGGLSSMAIKPAASYPDTTWYYTYCYQPLILPRFPGNTTAWTAGDTINNVSVKVLRSGRRNMLNQTMENYTMMTNPVSNPNLKTTLDNVVSLKATGYSDSVNSMLEYYISRDTINPFAIGQMGVYRQDADYVYQTPRNYANNSIRTTGLFSAWAFYPMTSPQYQVCNTTAGSLTHDPALPPYHITSLMYPNKSRDNNWRTARSVSKYSPYGKEVENIDAVGNYSNAVYGYDESLPVAVASNAKQGEVLAEGFEDYSLLHVTGNLMAFNYSPFAALFSLVSVRGSAAYSAFNTSGAGSVSMAKNIAHTGYYSLKLPATANLPLVNANYSVTIPVNTGFEPVLGDYYTNLTASTTETEYMPFETVSGSKYILSYWVKPVSPGANITSYTLPSNTGIKVGSTLTPVTFTSNIIEGWQQVQATFTAGATTYLCLPLNYYVDDIRIFPYNSDMKSFVYHPYNEKLIATLDENNFATFYEYDQEGNLVRTKKETEKGIMTISESRSNNPKK